MTSPPEERISLAPPSSAERAAISPEGPPAPQRTALPSSKTPAPPLSEAALPHAVPASWR